MSEFVPLAAERREQVGTGAARAVRGAGRVPAIVYGNRQDPEAISLDAVELLKQLHGPGFFSRVFELQLPGGKQRVLARELQREPVSGAPLHVDFLRFSAATRVDVEVGVVFRNEEASPGLKQGGMLNVVMHSIALDCKADSIPESISVDVGGLEIGDAIYLKDVPLPPGAEPKITDPEAVVATIATPTVAVEAAAEAEEEAAEAEERAAEGEGEAGEE